MSLLARAPFLAVFFGLVVLLSQGGGVAGILAALLAAGGLALCTFVSDRPGQWRVFVLVLCVSLLFSWPITAALDRQIALPSSVDAEGVVVLVRPWGRFYVAALETPDGGYVARLPFATLTEGTRVRLRGVPEAFRRASQGGGFDEELYWRARGMTARLVKAKIDPTPNQPWNFHLLRYAVDRALAIHTPELVGAYLRAAWTGRRDPDLNEAHKAWGTSHLLAVSGYHVGVVMLAASCFFGAGRGRVAGLSALLWAYILLTGAPPSALRAGLMLQTALVGELLGRPASPLNSVSVAAALLLLYNPFLFWDVGWRLSVLAALTIAILLELKDLRGASFWLALSPLIWLLTYPQASYVFGGVPLAGVPLNFLAPEFFAFALSLASVTTLFHLAGFPLTGWLLGVLEGALRLWGVVADRLAALTPWRLDWEPLLVWCCAGLFLALTCRALRLSWRRTAVMATVGTAMTFVLFL